uniref:sulfopyruvate decarboxylase n=2 Tax=Candidatus Methanogaster sp. ANME-2c ERB4 TaxID=2759911 RepID=A0A7G9Y5E8_9EURY|nr:sulfopyruvate decarboxylase subunit beta [Methanosarcinales archaeon ANME-2c ERB4]QNO43232.1 sulfopyruvate decarboxylase subunit beta [Methanosarcinales archaeon ANME-2c ERB4]QNO45627.1 sulfopyruvate decarboxylase subunit beta [Methanosarcinales archaeon ANME-2c ERB4]
MITRVSAIEAIAAELTDELVICNIGYPSRELYASNDKRTHFYMLGSMGLASSIGLGLALAQPRKVVVLDGDGSLLMNLGSLATIANHAPENYLLIVLDNQCYGSTGCQSTATAQETDLAAIASGAGVHSVRTVSTMDALRSGVHKSGVIVARVAVGNANVPIIDLTPAEIKSRFMREIVGA